MLLTLAICSCHTTHTATEHTTRQTQAAAVSHAREQSNVTADWWQSVRLAVDSAVVVFGDTLGGAGVLSSPGSRNEMATLSQPRASPRPAKVKLYGLRHATDAAMHTEVNTEREQNDSTHITGVTATDTSSREEVTGVARPPDVTIVLLLLAVAAVMYFRIKLFSKD